MSSYFRITTDTTGQIDVNPREVKIVTKDGLSEILSEGYLNRKAFGFQIKPTDIILIDYDLQEENGLCTFGMFKPFFIGNQIILFQWINPGFVTLPVVDGDVAVFDGETGKIKDSGASLSDPGSPTIASVSSFANGSIASFVDTSGTIGASTTNFVAHQQTGTATVTAITIPDAALIPPMNLHVQFVTQQNPSTILTAKIDIAGTATVTTTAAAGNYLIAYSAWKLQ